MRVEIDLRSVPGLTKRFRTSCHHARLALFTNYSDLELRCADPLHNVDEWPEYQLQQLPPNRGAEIIRQERDRQIFDEGFTEGHDQEHEPHELVLAAIAYLLASVEARGVDAPDQWWPWQLEYFKPGDRERNLAKAGALIAAEIDRARAVDGVSDND